MGIFGVVGWLIARQANRPARWGFTIGSAVLTIVFVVMIFRDDWVPNGPFLLSLLISLLNVAAAAWLFSPAARRWFRGERSIEDIAGDFA